MFSTIGNFFGGIWRGISSGVSKVWGAIKSAPEAALGLAALILGRGKTPQPGEPGYQAPQPTVFGIPLLWVGAILLVGYFVLKKAG